MSKEYSALQELQKTIDSAVSQATIIAAAVKATDQPERDTIHNDAHEILGISFSNLKKEIEIIL